VSEKLVCHCSLVRGAARTITRFYDERLAPARVTATQYALLRAINRAHNPSLTELGRDLDLERSTLGRNLRSLENAGLVRMRWGKDRRARAISLTTKGRAAMNKGFQLWAAAQAEIERALGPELLGHVARLAQEIQSLG